MVLLSKVLATTSLLSLLKAFVDYLFNISVLILEFLLIFAAFSLVF